MQWAGVDDLPFKWVTTYENSRYCKPNLRYFDDACARLGHAPEACLVVGDEHMDMVARNIGCDTFLVEGPTNALQPSTPEPTYRGASPTYHAPQEVAGWPSPKQPLISPFDRVDEHNSMRPTSLPSPQVTPSTTRTPRSSRRCCRS